MPCIIHNYTLVNNHYNEAGVLDTEHYSKEGWRTEKVCEKCGEKPAIPEYLTKKLYVKM